MLAHRDTACPISMTVVTLCLLYLAKESSKFSPGPQFTGKTPSQWYRYSNYQFETVVRASYVYNWDFYNPKTASF